MNLLQQLSGMENLEPDAIVATINAPKRLIRSSVSVLPPEWEDKLVYVELNHNTSFWNDERYGPPPEEGSKRAFFAGPGGGLRGRIEYAGVWRAQEAWEAICFDLTSDYHFVMVEDQTRKAERHAGYFGTEVLYYE